MGDSETACFGGFGGKQGRSDVFCRCSGRPGSVSRRFTAAIRGPGWDIARGSTIIDGHVDDDMAVILDRSRCGTGRGTDWGE